MISLDAVFVDVDDFCLAFIPAWEKHLISSGFKQSNKPSRLCISEIMTESATLISRLINSEFGGV